MRRDDFLKRAGDSIRKSGYVLRALHFEDSQFMNPKKKKLISTSVPTSFNVPNPPPKLESRRHLTQRKYVQPAPSTAPCGKYFQLEYFIILFSKKIK